LGEGLGSLLLRGLEMVDSVSTLRTSRKWWTRLVQYITGRKWWTWIVHYIMGRKWWTQIVHYVLAGNGGLG